ncbi:MAG TPA: aminotransferase class V-fold PLP-dependent enzyme [Gemmatimonadaceae bacterium]|nr:aminotransferase class V-fold PLP-dependent enzyme [Gemmatimonadaceae bacterium]
MRPSTPGARVYDRRSFLGTVLRAGVALPALRPEAFQVLFRAEQIAGDRQPREVAEDEDYWAEIARAFDVDRTLVNLNNGGVSPAPAHVLEAMIRDLRFSNEIPVEHMWNVLEPRIESVRRDLAQMFGCDTEEIAITRNASESQETLILGIDLKRGDEVIVTNQNYPRMLTTWDQRARRDGIVVKTISFQVPPPSDDYLVERFREAVTPRTRVIEVTHITNLTGQIMPVREIVRMARAQGIVVFVDGAHAFAHFPFLRDDLECDYYGTSLHKWLHAPVGTGFLYVRRDRIGSIWPLMAAPASMQDDIRKFEEIGTHPAANHNAIAVAIAFNRGIGLDRKAARLRYLRDRWAKALAAESSRVRILTPLDDVHSCGIAMVDVDGLEPVRLRDWLWSKHRIMTTAIVHPEFRGLRITPSIYVMPQELDLFVDRVKLAIRTGI